MRKCRSLFAIAGLLAGIFAAGCGDSEPGITKAQEEAIKNPKTVNTRAPNTQESSKMAEEIGKYNEAHKNDKVEFNTTPK